MKKPICIPIDIFNLDVAVFRSEKQRVKVLLAEGVSGVSTLPGAAIATAYRDHTDDGEIRLNMVLKKGADISAVAHECVHIADFLMEEFGIPSGAENTEVRAYLVGHLVHNAKSFADDI